MTIPNAFFLSLIFLSFLSLAEGGEQSVDEPRVSVLLYDRGEKNTLPSESSETIKLIALIEEQLKTADNILRLAVLPDLIKQIQTQEIAIELCYNKPKDFSVFSGKKSISPLRLLIPLTGELAGEITTIFHGYPEYVSGPYRNRKGIENIKALLEKAGYLKTL